MKMNKTYERMVDLMLEAFDARRLSEVSPGFAGRRAGAVSQRAGAGNRPGSDTGGEEMPRVTGGRLHEPGEQIERIKRKFQDRRRAGKLPVGKASRVGAAEAEFEKGKKRGARGEKIAAALGGDPVERGIATGPHHAPQQREHPKTRSRFGRDPGGGREGGGSWAAAMMRGGHEDYPRRLR